MTEAMDEVVIMNIMSIGMYGYVNTKYVKLSVTLSMVVLNSKENYGFPKKRTPKP